MIPKIMDFNDTDRFEATDLTEEQIVERFVERAEEIKNYAMPDIEGRAKRARLRRDRRTCDHVLNAAGPMTHRNGTTEHESTAKPKPTRAAGYVSPWKMIT